jgi:hypothetical protein
MELVAAPDPSKAGVRRHPVVKWEGVVAGHAEDVFDPGIVQTREDVLNHGLGHASLPVCMSAFAQKVRLAFRDANIANSKYTVALAAVGAGLRKD